jgi:hypothetical protein
MLNIANQKIMGYFRPLREQISAKAQALFRDQNLDDDMIYATRKKFLDQIMLCEANNLMVLSEEMVQEANGDESKLTDIIFNSFCFIVDVKDLEFSSLNELDSHFGYLVVTDKYMSQENIGAYKALMKHFKYEPLSSTNPLFVINYEVIYFEFFFYYLGLLLEAKLHLNSKF